MSDSIDERDEEPSKLERARQEAIDVFQRAQTWTAPTGFVFVIDAVEMLVQGTTDPQPVDRLTAAKRIAIERKRAASLNAAIRRGDLKVFEYVEGGLPPVLVEAGQAPLNPLIKLAALVEFARSHLHLDLGGDTGATVLPSAIRYGDLSEWLAARQYQGDDFRAMAERAVAADNWKRDLMRAVNRGELVVRTPDTREPIDMPWDEGLVLTSELRPFLEGRGLGRVLAPVEFVDVDPVQAAAKTSEKTEPESRATEHWRLKPLTRADDLRRALHAHLDSADKTAAPPTASDVVSAWMANRPAGITRVTANEVSYLDARGLERPANLDAVAERIKRCIERARQH